MGARFPADDVMLLKVVSPFVLNAILTTKTEMIEFH